MKLIEATVVKVVGFDFTFFFDLFCSLVHMPKLLSSNLRENFY